MLKSTRLDKTFEPEKKKSSADKKRVEFARARHVNEWISFLFFASNVASFYPLSA